MKKIFTLGLLFAAMMFSTTASAQLKFGVKGGLNITDMSLSSDVLNSSNRTGYFIGPTVKFTLPLVGFGVDASALFDHRESAIKASGSTTVGNITETTVKQESIQIPVNVRFAFGVGDAASIFAFAGPQFGFNVGDKNQSLKQVADWRLKDSNFSINVGAGAMLINHLQVSANYNIACGKTGDVTLVNTATKVATGKNNSWQIAVAYFF